MKIAIIGAGFSGCNLYNNLKDKYEDITIPAPQILQMQIALENDIKEKTLKYSI